MLARRGRQTAEAKFRGWEKCGSPAQGFHFFGSHQRRLLITGNNLYGFRNIFKEATKTYFSDLSSYNNINYKITLFFWKSRKSIWFFFIHNLEEKVKKKKSVIGSLTPQHTSLSVLENNKAGRGYNRDLSPYIERDLISEVSIEKLAVKTTVQVKLTLLKSAVHFYKMGFCNTTNTLGPLSLQPSYQRFC